MPGLLLLLATTVLGGTATGAAQQSVEFVGSGQCKQCHEAVYSG
jgi:hypothetical protein